MLLGYRSQTQINNNHCNVGHKMLASCYKKVHLNKTAKKNQWSLPNLASRGNVTTTICNHFNIYLLTHWMCLFCTTFLEESSHLFQMINIFSKMFKYGVKKAGAPIWPLPRTKPQQPDCVTSLHILWVSCSCSLSHEEQF